jgi:hypothetical protein
MKFLIIPILVLFSFTACSKEAAKVTAKKFDTTTEKVNKAAEVKPEVPCDSKEDLLKKLEEKRKAEAEKGKGLSLQGGDTGCSIK